MIYYDILKILYVIYKNQTKTKMKDDPNILINLIDSYVVVNTIIDFEII